MGNLQCFSKCKNRDDDPTFDTYDRDRRLSKSVKSIKGVIDGKFSDKDSTKIASSLRSQ